MSDGKRDSAVRVFHSILDELSKDIVGAAPVTVGGEDVKIALLNIARSLPMSLVLTINLKRSFAQYSVKVHKKHLGSILGTWSPLRKTLAY